jgi:hypothetical protein
MTDRVYLAPALTVTLLENNLQPALLLARLISYMFPALLLALLPIDNSRSFLLVLLTDINTSPVKQFSSRLLTPLLSS